MQILCTQMDLISFKSAYKQRPKPLQFYAKWNNFEICKWLNGFAYSKNLITIGKIIIEFYYVLAAINEVNFKFVLFFLFSYHLKPQTTVFDTTVSNKRFSVFSCVNYDFDETQLIGQFVHQNHRPTEKFHQIFDFMACKHSARPSKFDVIRQMTRKKKLLLTSSGLLTTTFRHK